jgi:CLASP N terminal
MAFTSQSTSPRNAGYTPRKQQLEDGPIRDLVQTIEETRPEQWQKRTQALDDLIAQIPTGNEYSRREAWFNSPPLLRHLHQPIGELLKDPRSTVVKRTCECLMQIFAMCQSDAKYLFKDLMPIVLNVHAQTVQVIRSQVQAMVCEAIPIVPCKMAMPIWLDRLKTDKSRTVREACVLYLGMGLKHWATVNTNSDQPYLTEENWVQIATAFITTLRDPSPTVRSFAKSGIATIRDSQPGLWDEIIRDPDGPAGKDAKLQKWLIKVTEEGGEELGGGALNNDELSVASRFSHYSSASKAKATPATPSRTSAAAPSAFNSARPSSRGRAVPVQISVGKQQGAAPANATEKAPPRKGLGPPLRRPFGQAMNHQSGLGPGSPTNNNVYGGNSSGYPVPQLGTPPRPPVPPSPHRGRTINGLPHHRSPSPSPRRTEPRHQVPVRSRSASSASVQSTTDLRGDEIENRSAVSNVPRNRARPMPEALNGIGHAPNNTVSPETPDHNHHVNQVIDLTDKSSPQQLRQEPGYSSGVYSRASPTDMLDVTKSIDQTLADPYLQQQQQGSQYYAQQQLPLQQYLNQPPIEDPNGGVVEEGPFIASMNELKQHASRRRSRRSVHMKERWSRGESIGSNLGSPHPNVTTIANIPADAVSSLGGSMVHNYSSHEDPGKPIPPASLLPEHYVIAEQLLRVHKTHVDQIMETLKIEMDTLRDFEQSLEQEPAPTPDQVLDYFESVGLCLDQRTTAGNILQREMDRISKGAFSANPANGGNGINYQNSDGR